MEKKTVIQGSFESSKVKMRKRHEEVIKIPKIKFQKINFKKIAKFFFF
jgi:hypothetical protein